MIMPERRAVVRRQRQWWINERDNPQLGTYWVACGKLSKTRARRKEGSLYGMNIMHAFDSEEAYNARLAELRKNGERVQGGAEKRTLNTNDSRPASLAAAHGSVTVDDLIAELEARGLGWSLDNTGRLIEARVWDWPNVVGRYRPRAVEPLAKMLAEAMYQVDWTRYPAKSLNDALCHNQSKSL